MKTGISVAEARSLVLAATPCLGRETVPAAEALGRVLAEEVLATRSLPPQDVSAMDGYAVRAAELAAAAPGAPVALRVAFEVAAGAAPARALGPGEAARIFTGAPLPPGSDTVVRQEDTRREGERVWIGVAPRPGEDVRPAGEDLRAGERVLAAGQVLGPAELGLLASLGRTIVSVRQRPRVALLSGGDELVEPDGDVAGGRIVSSNSYSLAALCLRAGAVPRYLGIARDTPQSLEETLRAGLRDDVLVSSAGVSVGDRDYVRPVLERLGAELVFWGVEMRPGHPLAFARFPGGGPLVFGLPGNPVSAMVTFELFVRPALRKLAGHTALFRPTLRARLGETLRKAPGRAHFVRVRLERADGGYLARSTGSQSSGVLRSMSLAQGLLVFPAEARELREGETALVQVLDDEFFFSEEPGF
jgi:molybdopterin molybdotransferase